MYVEKLKDGTTMVIFPNGKCRIMGLKALSTDAIPCKVVFERLISMTVSFAIGHRIDLQKLATKVACTYEPEIFPALRLDDFRPQCVNVFHSGKVVITGLQQRNRCDKYVVQVSKTINRGLQK